MAKEKAPPGKKNRIARRKMLRLYDRETGATIANLRWRPHGEVFVEHADYVQPKVVNDQSADLDSGKTA